MPSLWAGVLIGLSICAYGIDRPRTGVALGLAAVFIRELAMPYCLVAAAMVFATAISPAHQPGSDGLAAGPRGFNQRHALVCDFFTVSASLLGRLAPAPTRKKVVV